MLTEFDFQNCTILIIDDTLANLGVLAGYLEDCGFEIMVAQDGESGLEKAHYTQPDLILLDVLMPGIDGFETCRRLKASEITKDIPVIFMTSLTRTEDKLKGFDVGAVDYVTKPLQQQEVFARVTTHLRIRDLTQNLQQANEELAQLNANKDKFFSIVSHDLRGPFVPLLGWSEMLYSTVNEASPEVKEISQRIYRSAKNVSTLLENLLQWSRMQMGGIEYEPFRVSLNAVVHNNIDLLAEYAESKCISLQSKLPENIFVYADKNMLNSVLRNLITNAIKFTPKKGMVTISVKVDNSSAEFVKILVADTGVGISQKNLNKLFNIEVDHTTKGTAKEEGTGLGLIICREMVEKHGGQILLESKVGQGTSVKFTIPLDTSSQVKLPLYK